MTISLKPLHHRNKECIGIYYSKNAGNITRSFDDLWKTGDIDW